MRRMLQKFGRNLSHKTLIVIMTVKESVTMIVIVIGIGSENMIETGIVIVTKIMIGIWIEIGTKIGNETVTETMAVILTMMGHILMIVVPDTKIAGEGKDLPRIVITIMMLNPKVQRHLILRWKRNL
jgi:hypothetical protein